MKMKVYSRVDRGLEDLVIQDLKKEFNIKAEFKDIRGKVFYEADLEQIIKLNLSARSINRVIILLEKAEIQGLEDIEKKVKNIDFTNYIEENQSFAIRANRIGKQKFTSLDIAKVAGQAIIESYKESTGKKLKVNLNNPDVEIVVEAIDNKLLVGLDTTGLSLHIRRYRVFNHPMPLKTTIGYLLVKLSGWNQKDLLVDPTCGGATIPIEAAHYMKKIPTCFFRTLDEFLMTKLTLFEREKIEKMCQELTKGILRDRNAPIYGIDINEDYVKGAKLNVENAHVDDTVTIIHGNALELDKYINERIPYIIANPPYSLPNRSEIISFYKKFAKTIQNVLEEGGSATMITAESKLMRESLKNTKLEIIHERTLPYGSLYVTIFKITKSN